MRHPCVLLPLCFVRRAGVAIVLLASLSCRDSRIAHKVYPVSGKSWSTANPAGDCQIFLNATFADKHPVAHGHDKRKGEFPGYYYYANDGAPEGEYIATIEWRDRGGKLVSDALDRLGGAYMNIAKNKGLAGFVVNVPKQSSEIPIRPEAIRRGKAATARDEKRFDFSGTARWGWDK